MMLDTTRPARTPAPSKLLLLSLVALMLGAFALFLERSVLRQGDEGDLISPYVASIRFSHYTDPYTLKHFVEDWHAAGAPASTPLKADMDAVAYPPTTLLVVAPYAHLPWGVATKLYIWMCAALYLLLVYLLALQVGVLWSDPRRLLFTSFALALAPVQTGIHEGNLSIFAFLCCAFALLLAQRSRAIAAGLLLTLGIFIKPTVGFTLILLFLVTRRWRVLGVCVGAGAVLAAMTAVHMLHVDPIWRTHYQQAVALIVSNDGPGSFTSRSEGRFDLLNLQLPIYELFRNALVANVVAWAAALAFAGAWTMLMLRKARLTPHEAHRHAQWDWADIGALALISLLPIYQRNYNAAVLIFAILWAFQHLERRVAKLLLGFSCVFLIPGEALLRNVIDPRLPIAVTSSYLWHAVVLPHAAWAVLPLTIITLIAMKVQQRSQAARAEADPVRRPELDMIVAS